jgi:hypothetical protein
MLIYEYKTYLFEYTFIELLLVVGQRVNRSQLYFFIIRYLIYFLKAQLKQFEQ